MRCTGCGSTKTIEEIQALHPKALSCCPERKMRGDDEFCDICGAHIGKDADACSQCG